MTFRATADEDAYVWGEYSSPELVYVEDLA